MPMMLSALPHPTFRMGPFHEHWPTIAGLNTMGKRNPILFAENYSGGSNLSDVPFNEMAAAVSEGHCPWCKAPMTEWEPKPFEEVLDRSSFPHLTDGDLAEAAARANEDWSRFGWCECCGYGFRITR